MKRPFTIKTFYPTGDPTGLRMLFVRNRPIKAFYIPRNDINTFRKCFKKYSVLDGVYMLFNTDDLNDANKQSEVYIGKTTNILTRMRNHSESTDKEDWWDVELAFTVDDPADPLDDTGISYLEYLMCKRAAHSSFFKLDKKRGNEQHPKKPVVSKSDQFSYDTLYHNIDILSKSLGFDVFLNINRSKSFANPRHDDNLFVMNRRGCDGKAKYTDKGLMILKGSKITSLSPLKHFRSENYRNFPINDEGIFTKNKLCNYPSEASTIMIKGPSNGWHEWHKRGNKKKTLGKCYR